MTTPTQAHPRIALVCDWLTTPGGAEKVLLELHRMYPDAPIYTSQYRPRKIDWFDDAKVRTGWLNIFPAAWRKLLGPLRQLYFAHLDLREYDLVISVTGAEAKAVKARRHLCYCHVPTQYYWQLYDQYLANPGFGILNPIVRLGLKLLIRPLRRADYRSAQLPDQFVTISNYARQQIEQYYQRGATIIAPPVDLEQFTHAEERKHRRVQTTSDHFVIACRQVTWKRVDLAISACLQNHQALTVIGDGPEHQRLVKLAQNSPLIKFLPWSDSHQLAQAYREAKGYIFPSLEPFGMAAVEALAAGCPVLAYQAGGSLDIVQPGVNGQFFSEQTVASLSAALEDFDPQAFRPAKVATSAQKFSIQHFRTAITATVKQLLERKS